MNLEAHYDTATAWPNHSPWQDELSRRENFSSISEHVDTDVIIVGGGIAGMASAFFTLKNTNKRVVLLEANKIASGASGYNAGQLASYFERPLCSMVQEFNPKLVLEAQQAIDNAWYLLDEMIAEAACTLPVYRFTGHMGMWSDNHLDVHLRSNRLRKDAGLELEQCIISDQVCLGSLKRHYGDLFKVVPQSHIQNILETPSDRYIAALSFQKGTANSSELCNQLAIYLSRTYPERFRIFENSAVNHIKLDKHDATLTVGAYHVYSNRVVLCTNGYKDYEITSSTTLSSHSKPKSLQRTIGFMAAYFEPEKTISSAISYLASPAIGEGQAYYYVTKRPYSNNGKPGSLVCIGGPDKDLPHHVKYNPHRKIGNKIIKQLDDFIQPILTTTHGRKREYQWMWHGVMGYTNGGIRIIGEEPGNPALLYNYGCNGIGLLPSIYGASQVARLLNNEQLPKSLFDPVI